MLRRRPRSSRSGTNRGAGTASSPRKPRRSTMFRLFTAARRPRVCTSFVLVAQVPAQTRAAPQTRYLAADLRQLPRHRAVGRRVACPRWPASTPNTSPSR
jgi:hypothetical protein